MTLPLVELTMGDGWIPMLYNGQPAAKVRCAFCHAWRDQLTCIGADGMVYPNYECLTPGCGFYGAVRLTGWA